MSAPVVAALALGVLLLVALARLAPAYLGAWKAISAREREMAASGEARRVTPPSGLGVAFWTGGAAFSASAEAAGLPAGVGVEWIVAPSAGTAGHGIGRTTTGVYAHLDPGAGGAGERWTLATSVFGLERTAPLAVLGMALCRVGPTRRSATARDEDGRGPRPPRDALAA